MQRDNSESIAVDKNSSGKKGPAIKKTSIAWQSAKELYNSPERLTATAYAVMDGADVGGDTSVRLFQVFGNVMANHVNSDAYNPNSTFNHVAYKDPTHSAQGLTGAGWAMVGAGPLTAALRLGQHYYQIYRAKEVQSPEYLRRQLKRAQRVHGVVIDDEDEREEREAIRQQLLREMYLRESRQEPVKHEDKSKVALDPVSKFVNRVNDSIFVNTVNKIWQTLNTQSFIFWVIVFPVGIALGAAAAAAMPYVLLAVTAIGGALLAYEAIQKALAPKQPYQTANEKADAALSEKVEALAQAQIQQRLFIAKEHKMIMQKLGKYNVAEDAPSPEVEFDGIYKNTRAFDEVMKSSLARRLLGSKAERRANLIVSVASRAVSGFVATAFVLWIASTFVGVIPAFAAIGAFLGGSIATVGIGSAVAGLLGVSTYANVRKQQKLEEQRVYGLLTSQYKHEGISYLEKFETLEREVKDKKRSIKKLRKDIFDLEPSVDLVDYNLKHVDVNNHYYFEKQKYQPSLSTYFKKGLNRVYTLLGGGQTGIFVARCLFLVGGLAAGAVLASGVGAPFVFLGVALAVGITVGVLKLAQYQLERNQKHRQHFAETIDTRIDFLAKKKRELSLVEKILTVKKAEVLAQRAANAESAVALSRNVSSPSLRLGLLKTSSDVQATASSVTNTAAPEPNGVMTKVERKASASGLFGAPLVSQSAVNATPPSSDAVLSPDKKATPSVANVRRAPSGN